MGNEERVQRLWLGWAEEYPDEGSICVTAADANEADAKVREHLDADCDPKEPMPTAVRLLTEQDVDDLMEALASAQSAVATLMAKQAA